MPAEALAKVGGAAWEWLYCLSDIAVRKALATADGKLASHRFHRNRFLPQIQGFNLLNPAMRPGLAALRPSAVALRAMADRPR